MRRQSNKRRMERWKESIQIKQGQYSGWALTFMSGKLKN